MEYMESKMQDQIDGGISENERLHAELSRLRDLVREMRDALNAANRFIVNGIDLGFIRMPDADCPDPAHETPKIVRDAIAKADAILKESGEPVKYGCHADANSIVSGVFDGVFLDCLEEDCSQVKDGKCSGSHDCEHWRPIK